jgi:predicted DNA-binding ribbon-helix-helix protein
MGNFVTTVKLEEELYTRFKEINVRTKISLQDFVNKCIESYIENEEFRNSISESVSQKLSFDKPFTMSSGDDVSNS